MKIMKKRTLELGTFYLKGDHSDPVAVASIFPGGGGGAWTSKFPTVYTHQI